MWHECGAVPGYSWITCCSDCSAFLLIDLLLRQYCRVEDNVSIPDMFRLSFVVMCLYNAVIVGKAWWQIWQCLNMTPNYVSISMYVSYFRMQTGHSWNISIKCRTVQTWFVRTDVKCNRYVAISALCASPHAWDIWKSVPDATAGTADCQMWATYGV